MRSLGGTNPPEPPQMDLPKNHFLKAKFNNIDFSQLGSGAVLAKWLKAPVFEIVVIEQSSVEILNLTSVLTKPQMI